MAVDEEREKALTIDLGSYTSLFEKSPTSLSVGLFHKSSAGSPQVAEGEECANVIK